MENGLQMVTPDRSEVVEWREIVSDSHRRLAAEGTFDPELLERMQTLITDYRNGRIAASQ